MLFIRALEELRTIRRELKQINENLDRIIKRISVLHNERNVDASTPPLAWLTPEERIKASELRKKDPVTFEYVTEVLKTFLSSDN